MNETRQTMTMGELTNLEDAWQRARSEDDPPLAATWDDWSPAFREAMMARDIAQLAETIGVPVTDFKIRRRASHPIRITRAVLLALLDRLAESRTIRGCHAIARGRLRCALPRGHMGGCIPPLGPTKDTTTKRAKKTSRKGR